MSTLRARLVAIIEKLNAGEHLTVSEEVDFITAPRDVLTDAGHECADRAAARSRATGHR